MPTACYPPAMASLQIKNVPDEVLQEVRRRAAQRHVSIRDYLLALVLADQRVPSLEDWLAGASDVAPVAVPAAVVAESISAGRDGRDQALTGSARAQA